MICNEFYLYTKDADILFDLPNLSMDRERRIFKSKIAELNKFDQISDMLFVKTEFGSFDELRFILQKYEGRYKIFDGYENQIPVNEILRMIDIQETGRDFQPVKEWREKFINSDDISILHCTFINL